MKKLISIIFIFAVVFYFSDSFSQTNSYAKKFGYFEISPSAGFLYPVGEMNGSYDLSGRAGLNVGYRINREMAVFVDFTYNALSHKEEDGPTNSYLAFTTGPRYYFTDKNLRSAIFLEGGVGAYLFTGESVSPSGPPGQQFEEPGQTRFGMNAGIGGDIYVSKNVGILLKSKYNTILGDNPRSFIGFDAGVNIHFTR